MDKTELEIRLNEQLRIYKESPNTTVTYIDLARLIEDLLDILKQKETIGFNGQINK